MAAAARRERAGVALPNRDEQGDRSRTALAPNRAARGPTPGRSRARWRHAPGPQNRGPGASDRTARGVRATEGRGPLVRGSGRRLGMQRGGRAFSRRRSDEETEGGRAMTIEPLVSEAREGLITRAKREGLVSVGYDVMDSPLGPLWIAVGPRGVLAIHYGPKPDRRPVPPRRGKRREPRRLCRRASGESLPPRTRARRGPGAGRRLAAGAPGALELSRRARAVRRTGKNRTEEGVPDGEIRIS